MRLLGIIIVMAALAFVYIPLGWGLLVWSWRTIGAFWGLW